MLGRAQLHEAQDFSLFELRQQRDRLLCFLRLGFFRLCFLIDGEESIEFDDGTRGPELDASGVDVHVCLVEDGGIHLRRHESAPDQCVELKKIAVQIRSKAFRTPIHRGGTDGLVRFLSRLLRFVVDRVVRQVDFAEFRLYQVADFVQGLLGNPRGVRSHIGDQPHGPFIADVHAFVESLGQDHGLLDGIIELACRVLLQFARDEGGDRVALLLPPVDSLYDELRIFHPVDDPTDCLFVADLPLLSVEQPGLRGEFRGLRSRQPRDQVPVLLRLEGPDFLLPLHDHSHGYGLNAPGRQTASNLLP